MHAFMLKVYMGYWKFVDRDEPTFADAGVQSFMTPASANVDSGRHQSVVTCQNEEYCCSLNRVGGEIFKR